MQKVKTRCWRDTASCENGDTVEVFFSVSDFYEGSRLFIHPSCGAIFAVDPATEHYQKKDFQQLKKSLNCPDCGRSLDDVLPYPENFRCPSAGKMEHYVMVPNEIPPNHEEVIADFWDPLS
jgi:rubredoxin